jgi:hypothetical protein
VDLIRRPARRKDEEMVERRRAGRRRRTIPRLKFVVAGELLARPFRSRRYDARRGVRIVQMDALPAGVVAMLVLAQPQPQATVAAAIVTPSPMKKAGKGVTRATDTVPEQSKRSAMVEPKRQRSPIAANDYDPEEPPTRG